jgi:hypothetical protein
MTESAAASGYQLVWELQPHRVVEVHKMQGQDPGTCCDTRNTEGLMVARSCAKPGSAGMRDRTFKVLG